MRRLTANEVKSDLKYHRKKINKLYKQSRLVNHAFTIWTFPHEKQLLHINSENSQFHAVADSVFLFFFSYHVFMVELWPMMVMII